MSIWKVFTIFGIVSTWAAKALDDNVITLKEAAELATDLAPVLGVSVDLDVSTLPIASGDLSEEQSEEIRPLPHKTEA